MSEYKSTTTAVNKSSKDVFEFLSSFDNFGKLMPDQVVNWQSNSETCSFTIQGLASLEMKMGEHIPYSKVEMVSHGKTPIKFKLFTLIDAVSDNESKVTVCIDADLNPMLRLMLEKPLTNLVEKMATKIPIHL